MTAAGGTADETRADGTGLDPTDSADASWAWLAVRVSGLILAVLVVLHFTVSFLTTDVAVTTAATMTDRWRSSWWRGAEWVVLSLALVHAALPLLHVVRVSDRSARVKLAWEVVVVGAAIVLVGAVSVVVLTYR